MNRRSLVYKIYFGATLVFLLFTVALRCIACLRDMNYANGYFEEKLLINVANTTLVVAILFALSYGLAEERDKKFIFNFSSPLNYVFSGTLGIALLFFARHSYTVFEKYKKLSEANKFNSINKESIASAKILSYIALALTVLAILSVIHFILATLIVKLKDTRRADFGLITVIFLSLYATYLYFNNEMPINTPAKVIDQSAYLASALFFLYETRISIGRERWRAYRTFGFISILLTAYSSIPSLIVYIADGAVISNSIYETLLSFVLLLFIGARLVLTSLLREDAESKTVTLIKAAFSERTKEIFPNQTEEYDPETDEELEAIVLEDRGDYYELNFEESDSSSETNDDSEEVPENEENTGN